MSAPSLSKLASGRSEVDTKHSGKIDLPELRLRHAIPLSMGGQIAYVLSQMGVLSALAHFRGAEAVGQFGMAMALTTPAFMFVNIRSSIATDVTHRYSYGEYATLIIVASVIAALASIAAGFIFASAGVMAILVVVALTKVFESVSSLAYGAFQQAGRIDKVAISLALRGILTVTLFTVLLAAGVPTAAAFFAQLIAWSMLAVLRDYPLGSRISTGTLVRPSGSWPRIWRLFRETMPLGTSHFVHSLLGSLPRLAVERYVGLSGVGILTVVNYFQQGGTLVFSALSQALNNRFARLRQQSEQQSLRRTISILLIFATVASVLGLLATEFAGEWVLRTFFGAEFAGAKNLLMLIAVALCASLFAVVPQSLMHAERRYTSFLWREVFAVLVCAICLAIWVPSQGLMGAGYAIVAASFARLLFMGAATMSRTARRSAAETIVGEGAA